MHAYIYNIYIYIWIDLFSMTAWWIPATICTKILHKPVLLAVSYSVLDVAPEVWYVENACIQYIDLLDNILQGTCMETRLVAFRARFCSLQWLALAWPTDPAWEQLFTLNPADAGVQVAHETRPRNIATRIWTLWSWLTNTAENNYELLRNQPKETRDIIKKSFAYAKINSCMVLQGTPNEVYINLPYG